MGNVSLEAYNRAGFAGLVYQQSPEVEVNVSIDSRNRCGLAIVAGTGVSKERTDIIINKNDASDIQFFLAPLPSVFHLPGAPSPRHKLKYFTLHLGLSVFSVDH